MEINLIILTLHIFSFILLGLSIILFNLSYFATSFNNNFLVKLSKNWKNSPIIDIKETNDSSCPSGYSILSFDDWPGTISGCICSGKINPQLTCGKNCQKIDSIPSSPFNTWNSKLFCVRRLGNNYLDLNIIPNNTACASNYKSCGKLDNLGNNLCVPMNSSCPINKLLLLNGNNISTSDNYTYTSVNFGNGKVLLFSNQNTSNQPLTGFKISENTPCIDPSFENQVFQRYPLDYFYNKDKCYNQFYGKFTDPNYLYLDSTNYLELLNQNYIYSSIQNLPGMANYNFNYATNIYSYFGYVGINYSCIQSINQQQLTASLIEAINYMAEFGPNVALFYIGIIFLYVSFVVFFVYGILIIIGKNGGLNLCCLVVSLIFTSISLLFSIASLILFSFYFDQIRKTNISFNLFSPFIYCGDSEYIKEVSSIKIIDSYNYTLIALIILIVNVCLHLYFLVWYVIVFKKEANEIEERMGQTQMVNNDNFPNENVMNEVKEVNEIQIKNKDNN